MWHYGRNGVDGVDGTYSRRPSVPARPKRRRGEREEERQGLVLLVVVGDDEAHAIYSLVFLRRPLGSFFFFCAFALWSAADAPCSRHFSLQSFLRFIWIGPPWQSCFKPRQGRRAPDPPGRGKHVPPTAEGRALCGWMSSSSSRNPNPGAFRGSTVCARRGVVLSSFPTRRRHVAPCAPPRNARRWV